MPTDDELERILREARAADVDGKWARWLEHVVREVRRLQSEVDHLMQEDEADGQTSSDTGLF